MATENNNYQQLLLDLERRLKKIYPDATIEQSLDLSGNSILLTTIPGVQIIESINVNALAITVTNFENKERARIRGN